MLVDLVFFALVISGFYLGYQKGIIQTLLLGISIFIGFALAVKISPLTHEFLIDFFKIDSFLLPLLGFILSFIGSMLFLRVLLRIIEEIFKTFDLNAFNRIMGGALVALVFLFLYSGILWFLEETNLLTEATKRKSETLKYMDAFLNQFDIIMKSIIVGFQQLAEEMKRLVTGQ